MVEMVNEAFRRRKLRRMKHKRTKYKRSVNISFTFRYLIFTFYKLCLHILLTPLHSPLTFDLHSDFYFRQGYNYLVYIQTHELSEIIPVSFSCRYPFSQSSRGIPRGLDLSRRRLDETLKMHSST